MYIAIAHFMALCDVEQIQFLTYNISFCIQYNFEILVRACVIMCAHARVFGNRAALAAAWYGARALFTYSCYPSNS